MHRSVPTRDGTQEHRATENRAEFVIDYREIKITVIGRKSGHKISIPVWFVLEGEKLYLYACQGIGHAVAPECAQEPVDSD
jgi:hypothetical protein